MVSAGSESWLSPGTSGEQPKTFGERVAAWNEALLKELLPLQAEPDTPVLLACDGEAVRAASARLDWVRGEPESEFCGDVKVAFSVGRINGFKNAVSSGFEDDPRPRQVPLFLGLLCLFVLAASRMAPDEERATHAYHHHLRDLLELPGQGALPHFQGIRTLFERLADWLARDLDGARGHLLVPDDPHPAWVGYAIAQTVFRARDRQILSLFFGERLRGGLEGLDPLPLIRRWGGRHQLTGHALALLDDPEMAQRVRAAIRGARASWDGAELVNIGEGSRLGRAFPARLHFLPHPPRLHLAANVTAPATLTVDGHEQTLEPGGEIAVPWTLLPDLSESEHLLGDPKAPSGAVRIPLLGPTVLFESSEEGLIHVAEPVEEVVWVLTRDPALLRELEPRRFRDNGVLPESWGLLRDVPVDALPGVERALAPTAERLPFTLESGLPLERVVYLGGYPPLLAAGELEVGDGRLTVSVDGIELGTIASGERLSLGGLEPGPHELAVGAGEYRARFHVDARGRREGYGSLVSRLDDRVLRAGGARPSGGEGPRVCGAALTQPYTGALPVFTRSPVALASLSRSGEIEHHPRPPTPAWFEDVELNDGRWEIVREGLIWLLSPEPRTGKPWARLERDVQLTGLSPGAAAIIRRMSEGDIAVSSRRHPTVGVDRWLALLELAEEAR
jgi:hypothetical protein